MDGAAGLALSAIVVALASPGVTWLALRRKSGAESYATEATGDKTYQQMAHEDRRDIEHMRLQLRRHDKRWLKLAEVLQACVHCPLDVPGEVSTKLAELDAMNHLGRIDG